MVWATPPRSAFWQADKHLDTFVTHMEGDYGASDNKENSFEAPQGG